MRVVRTFAVMQLRSPFFWDEAPRSRCSVPDVSEQHGGLIVGGRNVHGHDATSVENGNIKNSRRSVCHLQDFSVGHICGSAYVETTANLV